MYEVTLYVALKTSIEYSEVYSLKLKEEINRLSYLADVIKESDFETAKKYNKKAKILVTKNRKWSIIFHTFRNYVIVDRIIPAKMMTH
ncbi:MAG: hypothetical protein Q4F69_03580 [Bacteroidia bacterium]|nr:hypothetical protein [Bacteroidia bacterium]